MAKKRRSNVERYLLSNGEARFRVRKWVGSRLHGRREVKGGFRTEADALRWLRQVEQDVDEGKLGTRSAARTHTLKELIERYKLEKLVEASAGTQKTHAQQLAVSADFIGLDTKLANVTAARVGDFLFHLRSPIDQGGQGLAGATCNRYRAPLSKLFKFAKGPRVQWLDESPLDALERDAESKGRIQWLRNADEVAALLEACQTVDPHLHDFALLALNTGMRAGELLALTWDNVTIDEKKLEARLRLPKTKNGSVRTVFATEEAVPMLVRRRRGEEGPNVVQLRRSGLVFHKEGEPKRRYPYEAKFRKALKASKVTSIEVFHALRHTYTSHSLLGGTPATAVMEQTGHTTLSMLKRYGHADEKHQAAGVRNAMASLLGKKKTTEDDKQAGQTGEAKPNA